MFTKAIEKWHSGMQRKEGKKIMLEWPQVISTLPLKDILKNKTLTKAMVKDFLRMYIEKRAAQKHILCELALTYSAF